MNYQRQLQVMLAAAGWTQEKLAKELGVSFPALNAWLNNRAVPRRRMQQRIENLYFSIAGAGNVSDQDLQQAKQAIQKHQLTAKALITDKQALDKLTLHLTYHTNTIEGSTMTITDVEAVIFEHKVLANRSAVEQAEARNHQAALYWLLDIMAEQAKGFLITEDLILGIHLRLMNGIVSDAGQYRRHSVRIMGTQVPLANWQKIPELVTELIADLQTAHSEDLISQLARTHTRFEKIHPFSDGNGRTGRLLLLAQALQADCVPPLVIKERKQAYYAYLQKAQTTDQQAPLELFIAESIQFCAQLLKA